MKGGEDFFIEQIEQMAKLNGEELTPGEKEILKTPVDKIIQSGKLSPEKSKKLNDKCVETLKKAYAFATNDKNTMKDLNAQWWRDNNEFVYKYSKNVISGIVQNWYLSVGRKQEKQAVGCFSTIIVWIGIISSTILLLFLIIHIL